MKIREKRKHLRFLAAAKTAAECAVDSYNRVWHPYRNQATLMLIVNAWELLGKAVLLYEGEVIEKDNTGTTISAEIALHKLYLKKYLDKNQTHTIQQLISLRHEACHNVLPDIPDEIMQHLLFFGLKFFRETVQKRFPSHSKLLNASFLSISFVNQTTYADKIKKVVSKMRRSSQDKHLVWLLERGVKFDGESYISLQKFEKELSNKKKILSALQVQKFAREGEMVRIVPVEAPHNYTADITLRKGNKNNQALPVVVKKANVDIDYPYLTKDIAKLVGKDQNWVAKTFSNLKYKGDSRFHQTVRASSKSSIQKYSEAALNELKGYMRKNPHYNPYITEKENREKHGNNRSKNIST